MANIVSMTIIGEENIIIGVTKAAFYLIYCWHIASAICLFYSFVKSLPLVNVVSFTKYGGRTPAHS